MNYNTLIADTRLLAEGWKKDIESHCAVANPAGENTGLTETTACFAKSRVDTLIGRPHLQVFHREKLIHSNIDLKLKLVPNTNAYLFNTIAPEDHDPQDNYKVKIMEALFNSHQAYFSFLDSSSGNGNANQELLNPFQ